MLLLMVVVPASLLLLLLLSLLALLALQQQWLHPHTFSFQLDQGIFLQWSNAEAEFGFSCTLPIRSIQDQLKGII